MINFRQYINLVERIRWLIRLRWMAVAGVIFTVSIVNWILKLSLFLFPIAIIALALAIFNSIFSLILSHFEKKKLSNMYLWANRLANTQISLDLFVLAVLLHFSGGIENPFIFYFIFHMIIASILLSRRASFLQATLAAFLFITMVTLEYLGILPHYSLDRFVPSTLYNNPLYNFGVSLVFISTLYIAVYMATSISLKLREREKSLYEAEERFRSVAQTATDTIITINSLGNVVFWNQAAETMFGYSAYETIDEPFFAIITKKFRESYRFELKWEGTKENSKLIGKTIEMAGLRKDGSEFPLELSMASWKTGDEIFYTAIIRDITERKRAEEELRRYIEFVKNTIESLTHPFYVIDANDYTIKIANSATYFGDLEANTTCYSLTHNRKKPCSGSEHPCPIEKVKKTKKPVMVEHIHYDGKGNARNMEVYSYPIFDSDGNVEQIIEYNLDITERKKMQKKLKVYSEKLEQMVDERTAKLREAQDKLIKSERMAILGQVSAGIGHELRSPLVVIDSLASLILLQLKNADKRTLLRLNKIKEQINLSISIIKNLQNLAKIKIPYKVQLDIADVIIKGLSLAKLPRSIKVDKKVSKGKYYVSADKGQLLMVFKNLATNAAQAMGKKGSLLVAVAKNRKEWIEVSFKDSGPGITSKNLEQIFKPFYTTKADGMGFGLGVCQMIIEKHGGIIKAQSKKGEGATFIISLPEAAAAKEGA